MKASAKNKKKQGLGTGSGADYKPYLKAAEVPSSGTASEFNDWKHGRMITCLSQGEMKIYYLLRWNDDILDINEQYPLDNDIVDRIITGMTEGESVLTSGLLEDNRLSLTTDFLCTLRDGSKWAISVKPDPESINNPSDLRRIMIESLYWKQKHVKFNVMYSKDVNEVYYQNIKNAVRYYSEDSVFDDTSRFQHLVATKQVVLDMESKLLDYRKLAKQYFEGGAD